MGVTQHHCGFSLMSDTIPETSLIIPTYNRRQFALEAIESARHQVGIDLEIIVVDDGSSDDTCQWILELYPDVKLLEQPHKGGGAARNFGLSSASGRYVKFLDSDDLLTRDSLADQVAFADRSNADVCYGDWEFFGDLNAPEVGGQPLRVMGGPEDLLTALLGSWWGPPSIYLIKRDFIMNNGIRWDETLKRNQDMDFILSLALSGAEFKYCPGLVTRKRVHDQGMIMNSGRDVYGQHCEIIADRVLAALKSNGDLTEKRKQAVADLYWHASRLLYGIDSSDYERVVRKVETLYPRFVPECTTYASPKMKTAVRYLGMRGAERAFEMVSALRKLAEESISRR